MAIEIGVAASVAPGIPERGAASDGEADSGDENEHEMGAGCGAAEEGSGEANGTKKKKI